MSAPSVFISYSYDSKEHQAWALRLATDLRNAGVDASIDQWDLVPGQDMVAFMQHGITSADRVLLVCSDKYVAKADAGVGGVGYERLIVTAEVIESIETKKFIPIIRNNQSNQKIPKYLGPRIYIDFTNDDEYRKSLKKLCRELLGAPETTKPPLGLNPFSGEIPKNVQPMRMVGPTGTFATGESILDEEWFEEQCVASNEGVTKLGISGLMELRFALQTPINKSQIELRAAVEASQIKTFGWPIGVVIDNHKEYQPRPYEYGIRAEVSISKDVFYGGISYDYWAMAKNGDFYFLQNLFEDMRDNGKIFFNTRIVRVTEALLFAHGIYTKLGAPNDSQLSVRVTHRGLMGRTLSSIGNRRFIWLKQCREDKSESEIVTNLGSILDTLVTDVRCLLEPMFMLFEFTQFNEQVYEDIVRRFEKGEAS